MDHDVSIGPGECLLLILTLGDGFFHSPSTTFPHSGRGGAADIMGGSGFRRARPDLGRRLDDLGE